MKGYSYNFYDDINRTREGKFGSITRDDQVPFYSSWPYWPSCSTQVEQLANVVTEAGRPKPRGIVMIDERRYLYDPEWAQAVWDTPESQARANRLKQMRAHLTEKLMAAFWAPRQLGRG